MSEIDRKPPRLTRLVVVAALVAACVPNPSPTPTTVVSSDPAPTATALSSSPEPTPAPSPSTAPTLPPTSWEQVFALERGSLTDLVVWKKGLIGAGCVLGRSDCRQGVVVTSADGATWEVIEVDTPANVGFGRIDRVGDRLFALGYGEYGGYGGAVVLTSTDGRSWSRVRSSSFLGRSVDDIIRTPIGTFAFGSNAPPGSDNITGLVTWPVNGDGSFGTARVRERDSLLPLVAGVIWTGDEFLAWGGRRGPYASRITNVLSSTDASSLSLRGKIRGLRRGYVADIISVGDRLVAVGLEGQRHPLKPRAWTSIDEGRTWTPADVAGDDARMAMVELDGSGLIARGFESWGETSVPVSGTSRNGRTWTRLADDEDLPWVMGYSGLMPATVGRKTCVAGTLQFEDPSAAAIYCH